jgi:phage gp37-like protein
MSHSTPKTTVELLSLVDQAWTALEGTVARLEPAQLTDVRDPAGWAVKDHVMHVAAWEDALLARLSGRPVHEALGLDEATLSQDEDAENAAIFARHRHRPLAEVLEAARASHRAIRARLAALDDRAVAGSVADLVPPSAARDDSPAAAWIAGNTWEHYAAHHDWIRDLVDRG